LLQLHQPAACARGCENNTTPIAFLFMRLYIFFDCVDSFYSTKISQINYTWIKSNVFKLMQFTSIYSHKVFAVSRMSSSTSKMPAISGSLEFVSVTNKSWLSIEFVGGVVYSV
jgi:CRISPR/Cas system-associated protein endoribonuclease Cas2